MVKYLVKMEKPKKGEPAIYPEKWYHGGYHEFSDLNDARADAIRMYLKGWRSGSSYRVAQALGKTNVQGVQIYKNEDKTPFYGSVVRYNNKFYWILNISKKKYVLNMDGTVKSDGTKKQPSPFGL